MSSTVLHLGDAAVRITLAFPVVVGNLLALAGFVEPFHLLHGGLFIWADSARLTHQASDERLPVFTRVATDDAFHGGIRFERRRINAHRLTVDQAFFLGQLENPDE